MRPPSYYTSIVQSNDRAQGRIPSSSTSSSSSSSDYLSATRAATSTPSSYLRSSLSSSSSSSYVNRSHLPYVPQSTLLVAHCFTGVTSSTRPYGSVSASSSSSNSTSSSTSSGYMSSTMSRNSSVHLSSSSSIRVPSTKHSSNPYLTPTSQLSSYSSYTPSSRSSSSYLTTSGTTSYSATNRYRPTISSYSSSYYKPIRLRERPLLTQLTSSRRPTTTLTSTTDPSGDIRATKRTVIEDSKLDGEKDTSGVRGQHDPITTTTTTTTRDDEEFSRDIARNISRNKYLIKFREIDKPARGSLTTTFIPNDIKSIEDREAKEKEEEEEEEKKEGDSNKMKFSPEKTDLPRSLASQENDTTLEIDAVLPIIKAKETSQDLVEICDTTKTSSAATTTTSETVGTKKKVKKIKKKASGTKEVVSDRGEEETPVHVVVASSEKANSLKENQAPKEQPKLEITKPPKETTKPTLVETPKVDTTSEKTKSPTNILTSTISTKTLANIPATTSTVTKTPAKGETKLEAKVEESKKVVPKEEDSEKNLAPKKRNVRLKLKPMGAPKQATTKSADDSKVTAIQQAEKQPDISALNSTPAQSVIPNKENQEPVSQESKPATAVKTPVKVKKVLKKQASGEAKTTRVVKKSSKGTPPTDDLNDQTTTNGTSVTIKAKKEVKTKRKESNASAVASDKLLKVDTDIASMMKSKQLQQQQQASLISTGDTSASSGGLKSARIRFREYNYDDFNFLTVLGHGGWGFVILAELKEHDTCFAVKCIKKITIVEDDDYDSIMIERKVLALGNVNPFICKLFCTFETDGYLFFAMEYCAGGDLMFHVQREGKFTESRSRFYAAEIICAIRFLHNRHIIYRDLKLDNILLDSHGHIRLVDFGMCQCRTYREEMLPSNFCGTPEYISPEIIKGVPYNHSVDWWSFGVLLYEMVVGKMPFRGNDENELLWNVCYEQIHYPMFLTKDLTDLLKLLLEREPTKRMGMASCKAGDIYDQPFFRGINWTAIEQLKVEPPFIPEVRSRRDVQNFDSDFTESACELSPVDNETLGKIDQSQFQKFPYTNPDIFIFEQASAK